MEILIVNNVIKNVLNVLIIKIIAHYAREQIKLTHLIVNVHKIHYKFKILMIAFVNKIKLDKFFLLLIYRMFFLMSSMHRYNK